MKKINLFLSVLVFALALLVIGGATVAPAMQLQAVRVNAATAESNLTGTLLFDGKGRYTVPNQELKFGSVYQFFGHDWYLVCKNGSTATFWMVEPYTKTYFNATASSFADDYHNHDGSNIWANGYTSTAWEKASNEVIDLKESHIREFLRSEAASMIDNKAYAKYKDKVVAGYVMGNNLAKNDANTAVEHLYVSLSALDNVHPVDNNELTAFYNLNDDRLWLPAIAELRNWNIIADSTLDVLEPNILYWNNTTINNRAWLRSPDNVHSDYAYVVNVTAEEAFKRYHIANEAGVRPAIHLDIEKIDEEYADYLANPAKGGWWSDDWLKALFMTICIIGTIGIILVISAVVAKARRGK